MSWGKVFEMLGEVERVAGAALEEGREQRRGLLELSGSRERARAAARELSEQTARREAKTKSREEEKKPWEMEKARRWRWSESRKTRERSDGRRLALLRLRRVPSPTPRSNKADLLRSAAIARSIARGYDFHQQPSLHSDCFSFADPSTPTNAIPL